MTPAKPIPLPSSRADVQHNQAVRDELQAAQAVLDTLLAVREAAGQSSAVRVLRYAACYLQIPSDALVPFAGTGGPR